MTRNETEEADYIDDACRLCFEVIFNPYPSVDEIFQAVKYLQKKRAFNMPYCRCFIDDLLTWTRDDYRLDMPDVEFVEMTVEECHEHLWGTPTPYETNEDRVRDAIAHLLSGYETASFNSRIFEKTNATLLRMTWSSPHYAEPQPSPYDLDPRRVLRPIADDEELSLRVRLRAMDLLDGFQIDSPHCVCFPGDHKKATRAEILRWLEALQITPAAEDLVLDNTIFPDVLRVVRTSESRDAYPELAAMLDQFEEFAQSATAWTPYDLYTSLQPPQPGILPAPYLIDLKA